MLLHLNLGASLYLHPRLWFASAYAVTPATPKHATAVTAQRVHGAEGGGGRAFLGLDRFSFSYTTTTLS